MSETCTVAQAIRDKWASDLTLNAAIPAVDGQENRFFEDGMPLNVPADAYAVLEDRSAGNPNQITDSAFFEQKLYQLRIYAKTRSLLSQLSQQLVKVFFAAEGIDTGQGHACTWRVSTGVHGQFPDGTRFVQHYIRVTVTSGV